MNYWILIIIFVILAIVWYYQSTKNTLELFNGDGSMYCPKNVTCYDAAGQSYFDDPICLDPSNDPNKGLGCIGQSGYRYCGFNQFKPIKCPTTQTTPLAPIGPTPTPTAGNYRVNLVNECPVTVIAAALGPSKIAPANNKSWVLKTGESLSLDIPKDWETTQGNPAVNGPRFWARNGCSYDEQLGIASCETGDCANKLDCSAAGLAGSPPASLAEFCFNCGDGMTYYDVSLVDGSNMSIDIKPEKPYSATHPGDPNDPFWAVTNLCNKGQDLRDPTICPKNFQLLNTQIKNHNPNNKETVAACFSNCGKWAYEKGLLGGSVKCDPNIPEPNPTNERICQNWRKYCCQSATSGKPCTTDANCRESEACWNGTCQCRAFYKKPCDPKICTHPYCENTNTTEKFLNLDGLQNLGNTLNNTLGGLQGASNTFNTLKNLGKSFMGNTAVSAPIGSTSINPVNHISNALGNIGNTIGNSVSQAINQNINNLGQTLNTNLNSFGQNINKGLGGLLTKQAVVEKYRPDVSIKSSSSCPQGYNTQPKPAFCTNDSDCIGDDTFHYTCSSAYSWPNSPQTFNADSKEYTITFCPGGTPIEMSDSIHGIPDCSTLAAYPEYNYKQALQDCSNAVQNGKNLACARKTSDGPWSCGLNENSSCYNLGVLCKFN